MISDADGTLGPDTPTDRPHRLVAAAITAGGQSRRFGQDKALYLVEGASLLDRVARSLENHAPRLLIAPGGRYALRGWQNVPDLRPGDGPLAGLETALTLLETHPASNGWLAFSAVDLPNLTPRYWWLLESRISDTVQAVTGQDARGRPQPLAALYHVAVRPQVTALLDAGERRMQALLGQLETTSLPWDELGAAFPDVYANLNTPPGS